MNPAEFTWRSNEARRRGIRFLSPNELGQRPNPHEERFAHITELGNKSCDSFLQTISPNFSTKPWRTELPKRAERLSKLADRCYHEDDGNESGWRFKVENEIMYRFTVEVTCPRCRNRVWDSEIPAATTGLNEAREMLEHRRRNRQPCRCPKNWGDDFDREINVLFSDRAEARIKHIPALQIPSQRPRKSELMDRIYGLRQTENFRFILDSSDKRYIETSNIPLRESIKCSPLELRGGEPLLFPFLIVEAKSSKGRSRAETHMQSAFCIQQVLKIQRDLVIAAGNEIQWETEPLIWYIATRGEQWDVYAGFIEDDQNTTQYLVADLWSGNIRHRDSALQLLLIIDYVFDWARDVYRKAILGQLASLSICNLGQSDPDVFSTISRRMSHISSQNGMLSHRHTESRHSQSSFGTDVPSRRMPHISSQNDTMSHHTEYSQVSFGTERSNDEFGSLNITLPEGVIRDAAVIESRYILVRITENDVDEFLSSFRSSYDAQGWVSSALKCLEGSWRVSSDALLSMESLWTNTHRLQSEDYEYQEVFYMNMTISIFMADDWKPVRQLACLAVSKDALDALATKSGCMATFGYDANPEVEASSIEGVLERTLNQSIMDNLTAAVSMVCLSSCFYKQGRKMHNHLHVGQSSEMSTGLRFDRSPRMAQLVNYVYANHNFGEGEYFYSYFCSSRSQTKNMIQYRGATIEMWPQLPRLVLESEQQGVLVDGASDNTGLPRRGLFIFSEWLDYQSFSRVVDRVFQEGIYFKTLQLGPTFLSSVGFGYLNRPLRFNHEWRDQACSEVSMQWRQKLEDMMAAQGYHEGAALSCPIMVSSDEETETGE